jgi:hypothetical protein
MTNLTAEGVLLTANADARVLTYRLLPYGEKGRTSAGLLTASKGSVTLPADPSTMHLNIQHDRARPVGKATMISEDEHGLVAAFHIAATAAGNDLLLEAAEGLRPGVSVEIANPVIRRGALLAGALVHAGAVAEPAFPSALLVAADAGDLEVDGEIVEPDTVTINGVTYVKQTPQDEAAAAAESETEMGNLTAAHVAAAGVGSTITTEDRPLSANEVFKMVATAYRTNNQPLLTAALANVTHDDGDNDGDGLGEIAAAPSWLGEVYSKASYVRKYIPLISNGPLTSFKETGYNFGTLPVVAKYAGNKADVPTGSMTAVPVTFSVEQWAHAADLDRRFIDFGDTDVVRAFIEAQVNSYRKVTDIETAVDIVANANAFVPGTVPTGINNALAAIVDGALALFNTDFQPTFAIIGANLYRGLALTKKDQVPEYLNATIGLEVGSSPGGFKILPSALPEYIGQVVVGDGSSVKFKELGGGTPVRVEAEHVAQRGRDLGVFGYTSYQELADGGVIKATVTAGVGALGAEPEYEPESEAAYEAPTKSGK